MTEFVPADQAVRDDIVAREGLAGGGVGDQLLDLRGGGLQAGPDVVGQHLDGFRCDAIALGVDAALDVLGAASRVYIRFAGGAKPGELRQVKVDAHAIAAEAAEKLRQRIEFFDDETTPSQAWLRPEGWHGSIDFSVEANLGQPRRLIDVCAAADGVVAMFLASGGGRNRGIILEHEPAPGAAAPA